MAPNYRWTDELLARGWSRILTSAERHCLDWIAHYASREDGYVRTRRETLEARIDLPARTLRRCLAALKQYSLISIIQIDGRQMIALSQHVPFPPPTAGIMLARGHGWPESRPRMAEKRSQMAAQNHVSPVPARLQGPSPTPTKNREEENLRGLEVWQ